LCAVHPCIPFALPCTGSCASSSSPPGLHCALVYPRCVVNVLSIKHARSMSLTGNNRRSRIHQRGSGDTGLTPDQSPVTSRVASFRKINRFSGRRIYKARSSLSRRPRLSRAGSISSDDGFFVRGPIRFPELHLRIDRIHHGVVGTRDISVVTRREPSESSPFPTTSRNLPRRYDSYARCLPLADLSPLRSSSGEGVALIT